MTPLKTVLVGCGLIAQTKHLPAIRALRDEISLEGVCDTNAALARETARRCGAPHVFSALTDALRRVRPDLAVLCTPPQTHRPLGEEALRAGAHLFMEKPMALTAADCEAILRAAHAAGRQVCVCFSQSFTPVVCRAHQLLAEGAIGKPLGMRIFLSTPADYMTTRPEHWVHRLPGGVLSETGPHVIHLATRFLGQVHRVHGVTRKRLPLDWSFADDLRFILECGKGNCSVTLLYAGRHWAAQIDVAGEEGHLTADLESGLLTRYRRPQLSGPAVLRSGASELLQTFRELSAAGIRFAAGRRKTGHRNLLERFVRSLRGTAPAPVDPSEGLEVARTLERLLAELKMG